MTDDKTYNAAATLGSLGGKASAKALNKEQRAARARNAALARWNKKKETGK